MGIYGIPAVYFVRSARRFKAPFHFILTMVRPCDIIFLFQRRETEDEPAHVYIASKSRAGTSVWVFLCPWCLPEGEGDEADG